MRFLDITGQRFFRLIAQWPIGLDKRGNVSWLCLCDCGKLSYVKVGELRCGKTKSCGCWKRENAAECARARKGPQGEYAFRQLFAQYKTEAKKRKLEFTLTNTEFRSLIHRPCYYCGIFPNRKFKLSSGDSLICGGIDRRDNSKGYVLENCVPCCKTCNYMKRVLSEIDFINQCKKIVKCHHVI